MSVAGRNRNLARSITRLINRQAMTREHATDTICRAFHLTSEELADLCGTTREPLSHLDGASLPHFWGLFRAAKDWLAAGNPVPRREDLTDPSVMGDRTLYALLGETPLDLEAIRFAGNRLALRALPDRPLDDPFG